MRLLQALTKALEEAGIAREALHSFADNGMITPSGRDLGHGLEVGRIKYDAVFQIENYGDDSHLFAAFITAWLQDNDPAREQLGLADPDIDISMVDRKVCDIDLSIEFEEVLELVPDAKGPISYQGQQWRVAAVPIDVAETLNDMKGTADAD